MDFKNKAERQAFVENYVEWDLMCDITDISVKIYKKTLNNGAIIYATEFLNYLRHRKKFEAAVKYNLVLKIDDEYNVNSIYAEYHVAYNPNGCSISTIIDYLTKNRKELREENEN